MWELLQILSYGSKNIRNDVIKLLRTFRIKFGRNWLKFFSDFNSIENLL